jgi:hypothetical protein
MYSEILKPVAILAAWSMIMWLWMYATRVPALIRSPDYDANNSVGTIGADLRGKVPASVQWKADNYNHLMEQPTVFYAACVVIALTGTGDGMNATIAWAYVALRIVHSLVQVLWNRVLVRFAIHFVGSIPLLMLVTHAALAAFHGGAR